MRKINPTLPHATLLTKNSIPYIPEQVPCINWYHKLRAIKRHGLLASVLLILYWRVGWDTLLNGTIPVPRLRLPNWWQ